MILTSLKLSQFRNYRQFQLNFSRSTNVLVGNNAIGKSNVLEAIYLLATGNSFRAGKIEEMVAWGEEVAHVVGEVHSQKKSDETGDDFQLRVTLTRGTVQGKRTAKRSFVLNGVPRRKGDVAGLMPAVLFSPEDMDLVTGNPSLRRRYMDEVLTQVDAEYSRSLASYEKGLRRRNKLLDLIREGTAQRTTLAFWDQLLIKEGGAITQARERLVEAINQIPSLSGKLAVVYDRSTISPERLEHYKIEEVAAGYTLVGPHKDDFQVLDNERNLATYGSRGEQRMAVLWLKEAELTYLEKEFKEKPLLLLDDILSELDEHHEARVLALASEQQTVLTTTEERVVDLLKEKAGIVRLPLVEANQGA